ncbi:MAG: hypothetical protein HYT80_07305 [Euryarchaeota archaeon]|nr:hypothetical protein [Euryarchaeota archaeon]
MGVLRAAIALVVGLLAAGCATPSNPANLTGPEGTDEAAPEFPKTLEWGFKDCKAIVAVARVPASSIVPHLPAGFRPVAMSELLGAPSVADEANFGAEMFECRSGRGLNGEVVDASYASYYAFVEPPAKLRNASAFFHFIKWDVLIDDPGLRAALRESGVPAHDGTAQVIKFERRGDATLFQGHATMGSGGTIFFDGAVGAPYADATTFHEFTPTGAGLAQWWGKFVGISGRAGAGTLKVPAGSFAAKILGTSNEVPVAMYAATVSSLFGQLTLPGRAPLDPEPSHRHSP